MFEPFPNQDPSVSPQGGIGNKRTNKQSYGRAWTCTKNQLFHFGSCESLRYKTGTCCWLQNFTIIMVQMSLENGLLLVVIIYTCKNVCSAHLVTTPDPHDSHNEGTLTGICDSVEDGIRVASAVLNGLPHLQGPPGERGQQGIQGKITLSILGHKTSPIAGSHHINATKSQCPCFEWHRGRPGMEVTRVSCYSPQCAKQEQERTV